MLSAVYPNFPWQPWKFVHSPKLKLIPPEVVKSLKDILEIGTSFGAPTEREVELAELITKFFPSVQKVRLVNSGTEATMSAIFSFDEFDMPMMAPAHHAAPRHTTDRAPRLPASAPRGVALVMRYAACGGSWFRPPRASAARSLCVSRPWRPRCRNIA